MNYSSCQSQHSTNQKDTEDTPLYKPANHMLFLDLHFKKEMSVLAINSRMKTNHSSQMFSSLIEQFKGPFTPRTITVSFNNHCTSATIVKSTTTITITAFYYPSVWMILQLLLQLQFLCINIFLLLINFKSIGHFHTFFILI